MIDRWSTELKQNFPYFVNRLIIKKVRIGIKFNPVVELKIIHILCRRDLFCVNSEISFRYFTQKLNEAFWTIEIELFSRF